MKTDLPKRVKQPCPLCDGSGWRLNRGPDGKVIWSFLLNDSVPCECGALRLRYAKEKAEIARLALLAAALLSLNPKDDADEALPHF